MPRSWRQIKKLLEKKVDNGYSKDGNLYLTSGGIVVSDAIPVGSGSGGGGGLARWASLPTWMIS